MRTLRMGAAGLLLIGCVACAPAGDAELTPRSTLFVGIDVSESFQDDGRYDDAVAFAAHYIHGHLSGVGGLEEPRALFVGAIGGERPGQPQAFHPIHDFQGKAPAEIEADLREWFEPHDQYTDFNAFFQRAATLVQRQNLVLAPITLVLLTDGLHDVGRAASDADPTERFARIDLDPLEYLARNVTVRVLYPDPAIAVHWERDVPRDRVRMWTVDAVVMRGWREQLREPEPALAMADPRIGDAAPPPGDGARVPEAPPGEDAAETPETVETVDGPAPAAREGADTAADPAGPSATAGPETPYIEQPALWRWIADNVDFRVRRSVF